MIGSHDLMMPRKKARRWVCQFELDEQPGSLKSMKARRWVYQFELDEQPGSLESINTSNLGEQPGSLESMKASNLGEQPGSLESMNASNLDKQPGSNPAEEAGLIGTEAVRGQAVHHATNNGVAIVKLVRDIRLEIDERK